MRRCVQTFDWYCTIRPPLTYAHKQKRLQWAKKYMKTNEDSLVYC